MRFGGLVALSDSICDVEENSIQRDRPERRRQDHGVQLHHAEPAADRGRGLVRGERIDGLTPDRVAAAGISRTYQNIRLFRNITAIENLLVGMHLHLRSTWWGAVLHTPHTAPTRRRRMTRRCACCSSSGCAAAATCCAQSGLWRAAPAGDRPRAGDQAEAAAAGRADRGDEPARNERDDGVHPRGARAVQHHHPADRASDARGDVDVGSGHRAGPRREDRRGQRRPRCRKIRR
jgi:hypothetical protein